MRSHSATVRALVAGCFVAALVILGAATAQADNTNPNDYTKLPARVVVPPPQPPTQQASIQVTTATPAVVVPTSRSLPVTGADVVGIAAFGTVLLAAGIVLVKVRHRVESP